VVEVTAISPFEPRSNRLEDLSVQPREAVWQRRGTETPVGSAARSAVTPMADGRRRITIAERRVLRGCAADVRVVRLLLVADLAVATLNTSLERGIL
jgi:hypothetical protein